MFVIYCKSKNIFYPSLHNEGKEHEVNIIFFYCFKRCEKVFTFAELSASEKTEIKLLQVPKCTT
jgi:hypothetical protein